jgi:Amt family ammonium transporter
MSSFAVYLPTRVVVPTRMTGEEFVSMHRNFACVIALAIAPTAHAAGAIDELANNLHLIWIAVCAGLVLLMQPGFAFVESGFARAKNAVNVLMKNFTDCGLATIGYWFIGFGLMFGSNPTGFFGTDGFMPGDETNLVNVLYQTFFAATAATIISGAVAERIRYLPYLIGTVFVVALIYPVYGSWVWGGTAEQPGWLRELGFLDSAGGLAVHGVGGFIALAAIIVLGPRHGRFGRDGSARDIPGHSMPLAALGAFLLWIGWLGFNGGSTERDFSDLGRIVMNTHIAASTGIIGAISLQALRGNRILMSAVINGALGGLVGVTAAVKFVSPLGAALIGLASGVIVVSGSALLKRMRIDDVVDAVPVHGFCGVFGTVMTGVLYAAEPLDGSRMLVQLVGALAGVAWAFAAGWVVFKLIDMTVGLRAPTDHEQAGLDYTEHAELGYPEFQSIRTHRSADG